MADRINVPIDLEGFEVTESEVVAGVLEVGVRSTRRPACRHCGSTAVIGHGRHLRRIRDRMCAYPTVLLWTQRRVLCRDCGRTCRERHPAVADRRGITNRLRYRLFERACNEPFTDVAASEEVSAYRVVDAFDHHCSDHTDRSGIRPRVLSLDEHSFKKRFSYHTVISDPETGALIDTVEGRDRRAATEGLLRLDPQLRAGVETVTIDCHWPYRQAIEQVMPHVRIVADKFHVIRSVDMAAQKVRVRFGRRRYRQRMGRAGGTARQHNPANDPLVYRARWMFVKRERNLSPDEHARMHLLFDEAPVEIVAAWLLKEEFAAIYDAADRAEAECRLDAWIELVERVGLPELVNVWRTLQWWRGQILNHFDDRLTNAFAEGITNKIKVMKRRSYGFRNAERYRQKVLLCGRRRSSSGGPPHRIS